MPPSPSNPETSVPPAVARWIRTDCGRAKYLELAARPGPLARLRLAWFVVIAALRDLPLAWRNESGNGKGSNG
ncbi:MAG: hypothetical protein ACKO6F_08360 [Cyanobium sp.]